MPLPLPLFYFQKTVVSICFLLNQREWQRIGSSWLDKELRRDRQLLEPWVYGRHFSCLPYYTCKRLKKSAPERVLRASGVGALCSTPPFHLLLSDLPLLVWVSSSLGKFTTKGKRGWGKGCRYCAHTACIWKGGKDSKVHVEGEERDDGNYKGREEKERKEKESA